MKKEEINFGTALVNYACPICCRPAEEMILMNTVLTKEAKEEVEKCHNKCIGLSKNACKECLKRKDEAIYIVIIDPAKSKVDANGRIKHLYDAFYTGKYAAIKKGSPFFKSFPDMILTTDNGVQFMLMEEDAAKEIGLLKNES